MSDDKTKNVWSKTRDEEWPREADRREWRAALHWTQEVQRTGPFEWHSSLTFIAISQKYVVIEVRHAKSREAAIEAVLEAGRCAGFDMPDEPESSSETEKEG